jgi:hypothetical protein
MALGGEVSTLLTRTGQNVRLWSHVGTVCGAGLSEIRLAIFRKPSAMANGRTRIA